MKRRVVITGIGIWSCLGTSCDEVRQSLYEGRSGIGVEPEEREQILGIIHTHTGNIENG